MLLSCRERELMSSRYCVAQAKANHALMIYFADDKHPFGRRRELELCDWARRTRGQGAGTREWKICLGAIKAGA